MAVNHLAHQLLGQPLLPLLRAGREPPPAWAIWPGIAWSPGLVIPRGRGGFFRSSSQHNEGGQRLFALVARDLLRLTEMVAAAGSLLASLASDPAHGARPSATDATACWGLAAALREVSKPLVGLS